MKVLLFARIRDQVGQAFVEVTEGLTIAELRQVLQQQFPEQASLFDSGYALIAVNQALASEETQVLQAQDEVAVLPPMTGG